MSHNALGLSLHAGHLLHLPALRILNLVDSCGGLSHALVQVLSEAILNPDEAFRISLQEDLRLNQNAIGA